MADQQLLQAARTGDVDAVRAEIAAGTDVEARDEHQRTPLLLAALGDHVDVARELVEAGADPNAQDDRRDSAFLATGVTGSVAMLEALLPANPDFTVTNRFGGIAIIPASERGHVDYVRAAARAGLNVNRLGWTALLEAVILGDGSRPYQEIVQILLDAGADANIPDNDGVTALRHAEAHGYAKIAEPLRPAT
ncbi:ankyrin repeat domain-containing protein [Saccharopolyspora sp. NPDC050389]|uniref:ankyrin repeat domain-containing protein n=1 Tax=Saccharopolyspora sp. NPDC050389 TaxID=3155516 RepID=UPI0033F90519